MFPCCSGSVLNSTVHPVCLFPGSYQLLLPQGEGSQGLLVGGQQGRQNVCPQKKRAELLTGTQGHHRRPWDAGAANQEEQRVLLPCTEAQPQEPLLPFHFPLFSWQCLPKQRLKSFPTPRGFNHPCPFRNRGRLWPHKV